MFAWSTSLMPERLGAEIGGNHVERGDRRLREEVCHEKIPYVLVPQDHVRQAAGGAIGRMSIPTTRPLSPTTGRFHLEPPTGCRPQVEHLVGRA